MARFQRGSLRIESRSKGDTWVLRYFITRPFDGRRVEHKLPVGLVRDFPTEHSAWEEVQRQHLHLQINKTDFKGLWVLKTARIPVLKLVLPLSRLLIGGSHTMRDVLCKRKHRGHTSAAEELKKGSTRILACEEFAYAATA